MNIIKREWNCYRRQTIYWTIGLLLLLFLSFYKVSGLSSTPGGMEAIMKSLPPALKVFFGEVSGAGTAIGSYRMIHLYLAIALALHAVVLGSHIFTKEEQDKTYEFLYVKGVKRIRILLDKVIVGITLLIFLDIVVLLGVFVASACFEMTLALTDILPYIYLLLVMQIFFFTFALLVSLLMANNQKAGIIGSCTVFAMFMITMYVKIGGSLSVIEDLSIFHYSDAAYIQRNGYGGLPVFTIFIIAVGFFVVAQFLHNRRDLL